MADGDDTIWARAGGTEPFHRLVSRFYERVATDPVLRPMYPDDDLVEAAEHLEGFVVQLAGGPPVYSIRRGHPAMRRRHMRFVIDRHAAEVWLTHMLASLDESGFPQNVRQEMADYFGRAAVFLINTDDDDAASPGLPGAPHAR